MRWSEFLNKECVDLISGEKLGNFSYSDLIIDPSTGSIQSICMPIRTSFFKKNITSLELSWHMIRKVGPEMVIIDSSIGKTGMR
ncbi:YlmC/YmxH family sporulation protein [Thermoflavimicrobium daqui]|uniref:YlmC/YmxH family sporulation protein n=1 Tax=Thermoflavimicrobium daqui TaxID=2137476 RepID=A0A364K7S5_9BACL|nr:YlmC/YmxH family sporulation protein [Thermoflavimicrobium daqui]RAL26343.1 YlmC/YmxH family sporulation protein [Thermoflavimicrobium daqui]